MQFKSIAECSKGSILQYFRPSLEEFIRFFARANGSEKVLRDNIFSTMGKVSNLQEYL